VQGLVSDLDGQAIAGAVVWLAKFPSSSSRLAETRSGRSGQFTLTLGPGVGVSEADWLVLGGSHVAWRESREIFQLGDQTDLQQFRIALRPREENLAEPNLNDLDAWLLPRLGHAEKCHVGEDASCGAFRTALAAYRNRPTNPSSFEEVWKATQDATLPQARILNVLALLRLGAWKAAERSLTAAFPDDNPLPEDLFLRGVALNLLRQPEKAAQVLARASQLFGDNGLIELEAGRASYWLEDYTSALEKLAAAQTHRAPLPSVHYLRARCLEAEGRIEAALLEAKALVKSLGRKRASGSAQRLVAELQARQQERPAPRVRSVMDQSIAELLRDIPDLEGLDPANRSLTESLPGLLKRVGAAVERFFRDFSNTAATEFLRQARLDKRGRVKSQRREEFSYVIFSRTEAGRTWMEEYRGNPAGRQTVPGGLDDGYMATTGFVASQIVLHPLWQEGISYRYLGTQLMDGRTVHVVGFAQRPQDSQPLGLFRVGQRKGVSLYVQGIAWISADQYQVTRLATFLLEPVPDVNLTQETTEIVYQPHRFASSPDLFWLPRRVTVSIDWGNKRLRNEHTFSKFRLFKVETEQAEPVRDFREGVAQPPR
jgi:hypothetical protein